ncbi:MAG: thioesterase family protein [Bacteroidaceae bacterium]|nr:thioesterase family protein [Bacteroidaceae bacterium]
MIKEGVEHVSKTIVSVDNTAKALGSGDLDVFATPAMVALMENAAMNAVASFLPEGATTVGAEVNTTHTKPSPIGAEILAKARLVTVEGRKLMFEVEAFDSVGLIGKGTHVRFIVDKERFMAKMK